MFVLMSDLSKFWNRVFLKPGKGAPAPKTHKRPAPAPTPAGAPASAPQEPPREAELKDFAYLTGPEDDGNDEKISNETMLEFFQRDLENCYR